MFENTITEWITESLRLFVLIKLQTIANNHPPFRGPTADFRSFFYQKENPGIFPGFVGPLGLEPRLFWTKTRRVASYTMGQYP